MEKQLKPQEIADLFAFITLDRPPSDPQAKPIPGARARNRGAQMTQAYRTLVSEVLPGFTTDKSGEEGVGLVAEHRGRFGVLRTHPVSRTEPCVLYRKVEIPKEKKAKLLLAVFARPPRRLAAHRASQRRGRTTARLTPKRPKTVGWSYRSISRGLPAKRSSYNYSIRPATGAGNSPIGGERRSSWNGQLAGAKALAGIVPATTLVIS